MSIVIQEINAFNQIITAVLDKDKILDLRKGRVSEHAKNCARYHAAKNDQGSILISRMGIKGARRISHILTVEHKS